MQKINYIVERATKFCSLAFGRILSTRTVHFPNTLKHFNHCFCAFVFWFLSKHLGVLLDSTNFINGRNKYIEIKVKIFLNLKHSHC